MKEKCDTYVGFRTNEFQNKVLPVYMHTDLTNRKPRILLHACCGPCSTSCVERLAFDYDVTVFYYNPNITDQEEYLLRRDNLIKFIDIYNIIKTNKINWYEIIEISNKHNIDDILLYVFIAINLIYHKTIPSFVIEALGKNNYDNIIDKYYDLKGEEHTWKMSFLDRLFYTESKKAEIKEKGLFNE